MRKRWSAMLSGAVLVGMITATSVAAAATDDTSTGGEQTPQTTEMRQMKDGTRDGRGLGQKARGVGNFAKQKRSSEWRAQLDMTLDEVEQKAAELGIDTEDKTIRELSKAFMEAELLEKAAELGIDTEDKEMSEISKEIFEAEIMNAADELGIDTTDKTTQEIAKEIMEAKVFAIADELGIDTEGKELREIVKEIADQDPDALQGINTPLMQEHKQGHRQGQNQG